MTSAVDTAADERRHLLVNGEANSTSSENEEDGTKWRHLKNFVVHCLTAMFVYTSFISLKNVEYLPGERSRQKTFVLWCLYSGMLTVCLFSPAIVRCLGYKWSIVLCFGAHSIQTVLAFSTYPYASGATGVLVGMTTGPFWTAQGLLMTTLAIRHGRDAEVSAHVSISRFTGLFYAFFQSSWVWAGLMSTNVLTKPEDVVWNVSYPVGEVCGAAFCGFPPEDSLPLIKAPSQKTVQALLGVYLGLCLVACVVKLAFFDDVKPLSGLRRRRQTLAECLLSPLKIHCDARFGLLIPLFVYSGVQQGFLLRDFTQAFVSCELGFGYVGYVLMTMAAVNTLSSFAVGQLEFCCGRLLLFLTAAILDVGLLVVMLKWSPGQGTKDDWLLYFIPGLWTISDSVWQTTLVALVAVDFDQQRDEAFAAMRFWQTAGLLVAFVCSLYVCMHTKLVLVLVLLCLSFPLYLVMEFYKRRLMNRPYIDLYEPIIE